MEEDFDQISSKKTTLEWDKYIDYLIEAIDESNFMKRSEDKPMQTSKHELEAHVSSRASHVRSAANIAKRIAKALGLNEDFIYAGMLMHDAGHPFSAHDGEEIFIGIGEEYNIDYFHHNAKGVEVVLDEDIVSKAINKIPNIKNRPELRKKLEQEFYYFLDIIISHDGEAASSEMNSKAQEYPDIKTAVFEKMKMANSTNNYKFVAQTIEGRIAKYADVIAYLSSDVLDRFRLGTQKQFDDDYLEFIGEILTEEFVSTREEKIEIAKNIIREIKEEKLMQLVSDARILGNKDIIKNADRIIERIHERIENYEELPIIVQEEYAKQIMEEYIEEYKKENYKEGMSNEEKKFINSDIGKIREFTRNKLRMRTAVVETITSRIREKIINDLLKESKSKGDLDFSIEMKKLFFRAKELNYRYVPDTKWDYQKEEMPIAIYKLVHLVALDLRKSGIIQDKFYDKEIRKYITDEEALKYLKTLGYTDDNEYVDYRKKIGIKCISMGGKKFTSEGGQRKKALAKAELSNAAYHYVADFGYLFAKIYENTFLSVENQILSKIKNSIGRLPESEVKKRKTYINFLDSKIERREDYLKRKLIEKYGNDVESITEEQILEFAKPIIDNERKKMEGKIATQMAINFVAGMPDKGIKTHIKEILGVDVSNHSTRGSSIEEKKEFQKRYDTSVHEENKESDYGKNDQTSQINEIGKF